MQALLNLPRLPYSGNALLMRKMHKLFVFPSARHTIDKHAAELLANQRFSISEAELNNACPFYCVVSNDGTASAVGTSLLKLLGVDEKVFVGSSIGRWLDVDDEDGLNEGFSLVSMSSLRQRPFKLIARGCGVQLACEVVSVTTQRQPFWRSRGEKFLMIMRPLFGHYVEVDEAGLSLQDFSLTDPIRTDLLGTLMEESLREGLMSALGGDGLID